MWNCTLLVHFSHWIGFLRNAVRSRQTEKNPPSKCIEVHACATTASGSIGASSTACATVGFCWKTAQFGSREPIWLDFSITRQDLGKRRNIHLANVLKFMLARLQRLIPSELRDLLSQRSGFAEKQHNLALGSRSGWISPQRGTISANGEIYPQQMYWTSCCRDYSVWVHRSIELCCHNGWILLKNSIIWLSGANIEAIEVWIERGGVWGGRNPPRHG